MGCFDNLLGVRNRGGRSQQSAQNGHQQPISSSHAPTQSGAPIQRPTIIRSVSNNNGTPGSAFNIHSQPVWPEIRSSGSNLLRDVNGNIATETEASSIKPSDPILQLKTIIDEQLQDYVTALTAFMSSAYTHSNITIEDFHSQQKGHGVAALQTSCNAVLQSNNQEMTRIGRQATEVLLAQMDERYAHYVNPTDKSVFLNSLQKFCDSAAQHYSNYMTQCSESQSIPDKHERSQKEAMIYFNRYFQLFGWDMTDDWRHGLEEKIGKYYQELQAPVQPGQTQPAQVSIPVHTVKQNPLRNIGMYLSESAICVAVTNPDSTSNILIHELAAEIAFCSTGVRIGKSGPDQSSSFQVYNLITEKPSIHTIQVGSQSFKLSSEEILTAFFTELRARIRRITHTDTNKTVLAYPFFMSSFDKEKLSFSMKTAGFDKLRIFPSFLTTSVSFATDINHYNGQVGTKLVLVIHSSHKTFSASMIEIGPNYIAPLSVMGPENIPQYEGNFRHCHSKLYDDQDLRPEQTNYIKIMYNQALNRLFQDAARDPDYLVMVKKQGELSQLDELVKSFFNSDVLFRDVLDGPLAGAALFASELPLIPMPLKMNDLSRANLIVACEAKQVGGIKSFRNARFVPGEVFNIPIAIPGEGIVLTLKEEFIRGKLYSTVGQYQLVSRTGTVVNARLVCQVDQDGIFTVYATFPNGFKEGYMKRTYGLQVQSENSTSALKCLYTYYETNGIEKEPYDPIYENLPIRDALSTGGKGHRENKAFLKTQTNGHLVQKPDTITAAQEFIIPHEDILKLTKEKLETAVQDGLQRYKKIMTELADRKEPITDTTLKNFHDQVRKEVTTSLLFSFASIRPIHPQINEQVENALKKLEKELNSQIPILFKRHEVSLDRVTSSIAQLMLEAENHYEEEMDALRRKRNSSENKAWRHKELLEESEETFTAGLQKEGIVCEEHMLEELRHRLHKKFQQL